MSSLKRRVIALLAWTLVVVFLWHSPAHAEPILNNNEEEGLNAPSSSGSNSFSESGKSGNTDSDLDDDVPNPGEAHGELAGDATKDLDGITNTGSEYVEEALTSLIKARPNLQSLVTSSLVNPAELMTPSDDDGSLVGFTSTTGAAIKTPTLSSREVFMTEPSGLQLQIGLPGVERSAALSSSGRAVYSAVHPATHLTVDILDDATARMLAVIAAPNGVKQLRYDVSANVEFELIMRTDGGIDIRATNGLVVAHVDAPWAYDALGVEVPARYLIDGDALLLEVEHNHKFEYPIVADPRWRWGIVTGTIYFNRSETSQMAAGTISSALLLASLPSGASQILAAYVGELGIWAVTADNLGKCLKIKIGATWSWRSFWRPSVSYGHYTREGYIICH